MSKKVWLLVLLIIGITPIALFLVLSTEKQILSINLIKSAYNQLANPNPPTTPKITTLNNPAIPPKVVEASAKKLKIKISFLDNESRLFNPYGPGKILGSEGSGICVIKVGKKSEKIVLTAKHLLFDEEVRPEPLPKSSFSVAPDGLIKFGFYQYRAYAIYNGKTYNLAQVGLGRFGTEEDFVAFKIIDETNDIPALELEKNINLGDEVYISGIGPLKSFGNKRVIVDVIDNVFPGTLNAIIETDPIDQIRLRKLYRIEGRAIHGYSGGPVLNKLGKVIGMSLAVIRDVNFIHVASAIDLEFFINSLSPIK